MSSAKSTHVQLQSSTLNVSYKFHQAARKATIIRNILISLQGIMLQKIWDFFFLPLQSLLIALNNRYESLLLCSQKIYGFGFQPGHSGDMMEVAKKKKN